MEKQAVLRSSMWQKNQKETKYESKQI